MNDFVIARTARRHEQAMRRTLPVLLFALGVGCSSPSADDSSEVRFEKHTLSREFFAEGVGIFDVDRDGHPDIVTLPYWYSGPDFAPHEIATPAPLDPKTQYSSVYGIYPQDLDGDGCLDMIVAPREVDPSMSWYRNPRGADGRCGREEHWERHEVLTKGYQAGTANPIVAPLFAAGPPVLILAESTSQTLGWWEARPNGPWTLHPISRAGFAGAVVGIHGIGVGDVNGDGRPDVLHPMAWFEQTADRDRWIQHDFDSKLLNPADVARTCSRMFAWDVDGDGLADVLCSRPHDYGLFFWKQQRDGTFVEQTIDRTQLSQMHSLRLDDLDGDGVPEIITGKRWFAHPPPGDPGQNDPAVLLYWSVRRDATGPHFTSHVIDDDSGAGAAFAIDDLDGDGRPDIAVANKKGVFYFLRR